MFDTSKRVVANTPIELLQYVLIVNLLFGFSIFILFAVCRYLYLHFGVVKMIGLCFSESECVFFEFFSSFKY